MTPELINLIILLDFGSCTKINVRFVLYLKETLKDFNSKLENFN